jgi:hypothetical protein
MMEESSTKIASAPEGVRVYACSKVNPEVELAKVVESLKTWNLWQVITCTGIRQWELEPRWHITMDFCCSHDDLPEEEEFVRVGIMPSSYYEIWPEFDVELFNTTTWVKYDKQAGTPMKTTDLYSDGVWKLE